MSDTPTQLANGSIERLGDATRQLKDQLARVIVGQHDVIELMLVSLFSRGHCLLEGPVAKSDLRPHSVHARPDAGRHHRH
jgi:hypothetical protein